jgi:hypothetical protein
VGLCLSLLLLHCVHLHVLVAGLLMTCCSSRQLLAAGQ